MGALADALGGRAAGELIRAADWNALVDAVDQLQATVATLSASVDSRFAAVAEDLAALGARVDAAQTGVANLDAALVDVRGRFRRVALQADRSSHVIGQSATVTARVADLQGTALDLSDAAARPWIDFVATWGRLDPAPGFESLDGAGERTVSVRVDAQGEARVIVRAELTEGLTDDDDEQVAGAMKTVLPGADFDLGEILMKAGTPVEASVRGAFSALSVEYDRPDSVGVRKIVDSHYVKAPSVGVGILGPIGGHLWRDHRTTVLAFARPDGNPLTPDPGLGFGSIQLSFRDWITPWLSLDYMTRVPELAGRYRDRLIPRIGDDFRATTEKIKVEVDEIVGGKGLVARQRDFRAIREAAGLITVADPPPFLAELSKSMRDAATMQETLNATGAFASREAEPAGAFALFADSAARAEGHAADVRVELTGEVQRQLGETQLFVLEKVRQEQQGLKDELFREDGPIKGVQRSLGDVATKVNGFQESLGRKADVTMLSRLLPG